MDDDEGETAAQASSVAVTVEAGTSDRASRSARAVVPPPSPPGATLERRRWSDPRLWVGVVLIVASGLGIVWAIEAADERVSVWALRSDVPAGSPITADHLTTVDVQVPVLASYWPASEPVADGLSATRDFAAGELLTRTGVDSERDGDIRIVTLPVLRNQMPADLAVGGRVDVYVVERGASGEPAGEPQLVLRNAIVAGVDGDSGTFGGTSLEVGVSLSLPDDQVSEVLDAQARGTLTLVDVPVTSP
ncbi:MAG TPA: hypothetical protein VFX15_13770 [Actinomycetes bacterium]|nr:hypothetical protein [Actinomycetes bacterium]